MNGLPDSFNQAYQSIGTQSSETTKTEQDVNQQTVVAETRSQNQVSKKRPFKCVYYDTPVRHQVRGCHRNFFSVAEMKKHLVRQHYIAHCEHCWSRTSCGSPCLNPPNRFVEFFFKRSFMTDDQFKQAKRRPRANENEEVTWHTLFRIVRPDTPFPNSIYKEDQKASRQSLKTLQNYLSGEESWDIWYHMVHTLDQNPLIKQMVCSYLNGEERSISGALDPDNRWKTFSEASSTPRVPLDPNSCANSLVSERGTQGLVVNPAVSFDPIMNPSLDTCEAIQDQSLSTTAPFFLTSANLFDKDFGTFLSPDPLHFATSLSDQSGGMTEALVYDGSASDIPGMSLSQFGTIDPSIGMDANQGMMGTSINHSDLVNFSGSDHRVLQNSTDHSWDQIAGSLGSHEDWGLGESPCAE